jgi:uncharacterized GH25 family protein
LNHKEDGEKTTLKQNPMKTKNGEMKIQHNMSDYFSSEQGKKAVKKYLEKPDNTWKHNCRVFINNAITLGKLTKTNICQKCHTEKETEFHHITYVKDPTFKNVIEVCQKCHGELDRC